MIALLLIAAVSFVDSTQTFYAQQNAAALETMLHRADSRFEELLCRYRLYPLTENDAYITPLPSEIANATARELALLSGLWGYRAARASIFSAIRYGRRSQRLLDEAKQKDPDDPYVLLVEGQSLLFKPAFAGRDEEAALDRFHKLCELLQQPNEDTGISMMEAELWRWYALHRLDIDRASDVREQLLASDPPPLYRQFLEDPP